MFPLVITLFLITFFFIVCKNENDKKKKRNCGRKLTLVTIWDLDEVQ